MLLIILIVLGFHEVYAAGTVHIFFRELFVVVKFKVNNYCKIKLKKRVIAY